MPKARVKKMINIINENDKFKQINTAKWEKIASEILKKLNINNKNLDIIFTDEDFILDLNRKYLNHDYITDVIAFENTIDEPDFLGEIYICLEQAQRQAPEFNNSFEEELLTLIIHGILHLVGYNDIEPDDKKIMFDKQNKIFQEIKHEL